MTVGSETKSFVQKTVLLVGPIAETGMPSPGGFETANRRTIDMLRGQGVLVKELPYTEPGSHPTKGINKWVRYSQRFRTIRQEIQKQDSNAVLHFTPLYKQFLWWEVPVAELAKKTSMRIVVDIRAGQAEKHFLELGPIYRGRFRSLIAAADVVAVEGERYIDFVHAIRPDVDVHYLPNFLPDADITTSAPVRVAAPIRFVYVGSVNEAKGVLHATQLVAALAGRGVKVRFDVFGLSAPAFADRLRAAAGRADWLVLHGPQPFATIRTALAQAHFFIFLTVWRGEGHSNALTEAMGQGAIPIVTDHGFNRDVAGPEAVMVMDRDNLTQAASQIAKIISDPAGFDARAAGFIARVRERYTETSVLATLITLYQGSESARE